MSSYDSETLDAIKENLWQALCDGLDNAVAGLLFQHCDGMMCDGLTGHVGFEREVATDGGFFRRRFLGAAAAPSGMSLSPSNVAANEGSDNTDESGDGDVRAGVLIELPTNQTCELAAALFQAAEKLDRQLGGDNDDE